MVFEQKLFSIEKPRVACTRGWSLDINFHNKHTGLRRISVRKPMCRAPPNIFSIAKPRVACTFGWSSVYARLVAGHAFPPLIHRFALHFCTKSNVPSPAATNFCSKSNECMHARLVDGIYQFVFVRCPHMILLGQWPTWTPAVEKLLDNLFLLYSDDDGGGVTTKWHRIWATPISMGRGAFNRQCLP